LRLKRKEVENKGRPKFSWLEDSEKDLREMKATIWRKKAVDEEKWTSVIKEAKVEGNIHPQVSQAVYSLCDSQVKS
jgi:hypothetical protein